MKPVWISHKSYQNFVYQQLHIHYSGSVLTIVAKDWSVISKLWLTDLSYATTWLRDTYSMKGPAPRDPASMLRSYLLFLLTNPTIGITEWVNELYRVPLYAILSGFEPGDIPGVGTFYDFFRRIWGRAKPNVHSHLKPKRKKKKKKQKKGEKAAPPNPGIVKKLVERFLRYESPTPKQLPGDRLFSFFHSQFLEPSAKLGLLGDRNTLTVAGDGTPVETAAYPRSKSTCDCRIQGRRECNHPRHYSQPDCDSGWDSARGKYFNGYSLYMLTAANSKHDLPLYPQLHPASRHDAVSFIFNSLAFSQRFTLGTVDKMLLDAAHDAGAIYDLLIHQNVEPFIDLNVRGTNHLKTNSVMQISAKGIPICPMGKEMKPNGYDSSQKRQKWICPLMKGRTTNMCSTPCSTATYGRTFHTYSKDNPRLFPKTPRDSEKWKLIYKRRTTVERSNKREKIDYALEDGRHRSTKMWYIRTYGIMMCQHIDAWYSHQKAHLNLKQLIFPQSV